MAKINIFHLEIAISGNTNGVERCIRTLMDVSLFTSDVDVTWIRFTHNIVNRVYKQRIDNYNIIYFPISNELKELWGNNREKALFYNDVLALIKENTNTSHVGIVHLHTMNLIQLGIYIRENMGFKIVSTIHCIPWKSLYNNNVVLFNKLYERYYAGSTHKKEFLCDEYESMTYAESDSLVCVTNCGKEFITTINKQHTSKIVVIPNGLRDTKVKRNANTDVISCVFVGDANPSKGLNYLLECINMSQYTYNICLHVVGNYTKSELRGYHKKYPFNDMQFYGSLKWNKLIKIYEKCDIGLIASLHEQCSYVAIEMMMSGIPVISSNVDGLDEMFQHEYNALLFSANYTSKIGLHFDVKEIYNLLSYLITNQELRFKLSKNARETYLRKYTDIKMINSYICLYKTLVN